MLRSLIRSLQGHGQASVRKRSERTFGRWPLYEVAFGPRWSHGEQHGHAKALIAIGDQATGVIAIGGLAQGLIALGGVSEGLVAVGGCTLGLLVAFGGVAVGGLALGGVAIGVVTCAGRVDRRLGVRQNGRFARAII